MLPRSVSRALATLAPAVLFTACAGGGTAADSVNPIIPRVPVATVQVQPSVPPVVMAGDRTQFDAILRDARGQTLSGRAVTWTSSLPAVASVDAAGQVTAVSDGQSTITATSEGVSGTVSLTVRTPVARVELSVVTLTLLPGRAQTVTATARGANNTVLANRAIVWASTNSAVATVSPTGTITAVAVGSATITATSEGIVGVLVVTVTSFVAPTTSVVLSGSIASNRTLTADTNYVLRGFVYVNSGATLTINAGTRIVGDTTALGSALFVLRGARIVANGTAAAPVVFTSQRSAGNRSPGDWGGLVIVGNARANRTGNVIVEGSNGSVLGADPAGIVYTGGTVDTDNSGTLRYVRVEFAGYATLTDAELNSYTLAAVGSGTTIEYVQALAGLDDHFEWFGGTVNGKYLVSYESGDDHFDGSEGYRGLNQFLIGMQSTFLTPRAGAGAVSTDPQGFEIDGCNGGGCVAPSGANAQSAGRDEGLWNMNVFANFTLIGVPTGTTVPGSGGVGAVLRRGTGGYYLNGVVARWQRGGISLRDSTSNNRFLADSLIVRNLYFAENGGADGGFDAAGTNFGQASAFAGRNANIVVGTGVTAASLFTALPAAPTNAASMDWSPAANSPIATGGLASFANDPRIAARVGTFITPTAYRGAAAPGGTKWWEGWTSYARN